MSYVSIYLSICLSIFLSPPHSHKTRLTPQENAPTSRELKETTSRVRDTARQRGATAEELNERKKSEKKTTVVEQKLEK